MRVGVFGLGNVLRRDDGFGPSAIRYLEANWVLPDEATVLDLGTPGLDLPSHLVGYDAIVLLDTALGEGPAGTLHVHDRRALMAGPATAPSVTGHEGDVRTALKITELLDDGPHEVCLLGVVPEDTSDGMGLSPALREALEPVCQAACAQLRAWGIEPRRRGEAAASGAWWEGPAPLRAAANP